VWLTLPPTPTLPAATRKDTVRINGTDIFFAQFGGGSPVLLLHGGLANSNYWGHQVKELSQKYGVIVMDTRGHGRSPVTSSKFSYSIFVEDVLGLLDYLKIGAASVIGWSDGGITGLQLATRAPTRISRLFAFGANSSLDGLKTNGAKNRVFSTFVTRCKSEHAALSPTANRWPQLVSGLHAMWRTEPNFDSASLASITLPTTISDGDHDEIIKSDHTVGLAKAIRGARLVMLPGVSHFAMLQNPAQFNAAIAEFLEFKAQ